MVLSPAPFSSAPESSGVPVNGAGEIGHCSRCIFCTPGAYKNFKFVGGRMLPISSDIHCGAFDRRVTPLSGCATFWRVGVEFIPLPLEH